MGDMNQNFASRVIITTSAVGQVWISEPLLFVIVAALIVSTAPRVAVCWFSAPVCESGQISAAFGESALL